MLDQIPTTIRRVGDNKVLLSFEDSGTRKYWDGRVGFSHYMETKRDIIAERQKEIGDVALDSYDDDGAYISLHFSSNIIASTCEEVVAIANQILLEIEGATELRIGIDAFQPEPSQNERDFTLRTVLPILRKLGFSNVRYSHGKREYGKDIVFARFTEFGELEHWAAQVKHGDVSGATGGEIDEIFSQIEDAFRMPFYDIYTRTQVRPSKVCVIISGRFTENATEKVCEKIESHAIRNNVIFVDEAKLSTLAERFRKHI
jgi:Restriction endonuclease